MSPEKQRVAIAEACGWVTAFGKWRHPGDKFSTFKTPPAYRTDLNAMHKAEEARIYSDHDTYVRFENILIDMVEHPLHATAAQRAEAFLRTLGLWEETP